MDAADSSPAASYLLLFLPRRRCEIQEPRNRLQATLGGDHAEISSGNNRWPVLWRKVPLVTADGRLAFFSTTTIFGTPIDVTLSELALESFFPADGVTAAALRRLADGQA